MRLISKLQFYVFILFLSGNYYSQTLIINEVSNGPAGNQEYIEFIVVDDNAFYDCGNSAPPCVDIRGWIIDDNSGYHGAGGVAPGCNRFSLDPFWQCIPIGTLIVVYNNIDPNINLPANDLSMSDNNCRLVIPINNTQLFQSNLTTPGAIACSYPSTGWVNGGDWNTITLANTGDCARLVNLAGCEVSSLCWAGVNQNTQIYFSSGGSGTDNVWSFSDGSSTTQANWTEGCADNETVLDAATCGVNNQTPGVANNALNTSYIAQFNNNCQPITPLTLTVSGIVSQSCICDGSASVSATGSIGPYTYAWYDQFNIPLSQTTSTASNLCSGNYYCVVTSSIDCKDTIPVFVGSICSNYGTFASATMIQNCVNNQFYNTTWANLPDQINPSGVLFEGYDYGPFFQNSNTLILRGGEVKTFKNPGANVCGAKLNYTIYTVGNQPVNPVFTVLDLPFKESCTVGPNSFPTGGPCFNGTDQKWAKENYNIDLTTLAPGNYVLEVYYSVPGSFISTTACNDTIYVNNNGANYKAFFQIKPTPNITASAVNICPGNNSTLTSNYNTGNSWTGGSTNQSITVNSSGATTLTVNLNNNCPNQTDTETINVYASPTVEAGVNQSTCGTNAVTLNGVIGGSATGSQWVSPSGTFSNPNSLNTTFTPTITSGVATVILSATGPCPTIQDQLVILVNATPTVNAGVDQTICAGSSITISGSYGGSANASNWSAPSGSFANITNLNTTYTPSITSGTVTLTLSASGPCPTVTDQLILTVNSIPSANAGIDQSICAGSSVNLVGALGGGASSGSWSGGTGTFSPNSNLLNVTYTPSSAEISAGTVSLTLTTDDPTGPCVAVNDLVTVTIDPIAIVNAGLDQTICSNGSATLSGIIGGSATSAIWSGGSGTFSPNTSTLNASYTPSAAEINAGFVSLTLATNDPIGACSAVSDNVILTITAAPIVNAGNNTSICLGGTVTLNGSISGTNTGGVWSASSGTFSNINSFSSTYTPSISSGNITLTLTSVGPCPTVSDAVSINILQPNIPAFNQQGPYCVGTTFSLPTSSTNGIFGNWSPAINNSISTLYTFNPNSGQCATTATMSVVIISNQTNAVSMTVCPNQIPYNWNGLTFSGPGTQSVTLNNVNGCDSSVTLNLSVSNTITSSNSITICPSELPYSWNGLTFNAAGSQSANLTSVSGCDSIATLNLAVLAPQSSNSTITICSNQLPYSWNGLVFNGAGSQTTIIQDINGCDSSATLNLLVQNTLTSTTNISICQTELPYTWNNIVLSSGGTQTVNLVSVGGCDSVATIVLSLYPEYNTSESHTICSNEAPFSWNGFNLSNSTSQTITLQSVYGCDSVVTLNLTVLPETIINLDSTICSVLLPITWNNLIFNAAGSQSISLTNINGCDSIINYTLTVNSLPQVVSFDGGNQYCEGDIIIDIIAQVNGSGPYSLSYTYNGSNISTASSSGQFNLGNLPGSYTINSISDINCQNNISNLTENIEVFSIPPPPMASSDTLYCINIEPDSMSVNGNQNANFYWYNEPNLAIVIGQGTNYLPGTIQGTTAYYVVQDENGCVSLPDTILITYQACDVIIPTAFTPDNDNVNDSWSLTGIDLLYPKNVVTIYNRWGNILFQSDAGKYEISPWNGTYNNESMPVGSYFFIIEYGETYIENQIGIVSIIK